MKGGENKNAMTNEIKSLTQLREMRGLTLQEVAEKLGKKGIKRTKQSIWKYENGERRIPLEVAIPLSKILKTSPERIFFYSQGLQNVNKEPE